MLARKFVRRNPAARLAPDANDRRQLDQLGGGDHRPAAAAVVEPAGRGPLPVQCRPDERRR